MIFIVFLRLKIDQNLLRALEKRILKKILHLIEINVVVDPWNFRILGFKNKLFRFSLKFNYCRKQNQNVICNWKKTAIIINSANPQLFNSEIVKKFFFTYLHKLNFFCFCEKKICNFLVILPRSTICQVQNFPNFKKCLTNLANNFFYIVLTH